ncbi:MAG: hypothetical protein ACLSAO_01135 [Anaerovoracaceae bacterium]
MSPSRGDASQGTFFEVYGNLVIRYFLYYKKSVQDGIGDSSAHAMPAKLVLYKMILFCIFRIIKKSLANILNAKDFFIYKEFTI